MTATVTLTDEQQAAVDTLVRVPHDVQTCGGYAGTGKTTLIRHLVEVLRGWAVCAYTGKAADVLRRKGLQASTIHSLIYKPVEVDGGVEFVLREPHELFIEGFIVDEASMVSKTIHDDLRSFGLPIIYVGDHGQLEPVNSGSGGDDFCVMRDPQVRLETIHRNAGEIARFAGFLRTGGSAKDWRVECNPNTFERNNPLVPATWSTGQVNVITGAQLSGSDRMAGVDQVICAYNKTRVQLNRAYRECLGRSGGPAVGDRVMCLQNDREHGLFNGMQGIVTKINGYALSFEDEDGREYGKIPYVAEAFGSDKKPKRVFGKLPFDWCYCVTAHKFQGSEADSVLVLEQRCGLWDNHRWNYTAASRAKRKLTWVLESA